MKIGDLSASTGTPVETIRYYEREGLLDAPARSAGNFRLYDEGHVRRLGFIRACRALDMNLGEIRVLLRFRDGQEGDCAEVNALLDEHIGHVDERMRELRRLANELRALREECLKATDAGRCGILRRLDRAGSDAPPARAGSHVGHVHRKPGKAAG